MCLLFYVFVGVDLVEIYLWVVLFQVDVMVVVVFGVWVMVVVGVEGFEGFQVVIEIGFVQGFESMWVQVLGVVVFLLCQQVVVVLNDIGVGGVGWWLVDVGEDVVRGVVVEIVFFNVVGGGFGLIFGCVYEMVVVVGVFFVEGECMYYVVVVELMVEGLFG